MQQQEIIQVVNQMVYECTEFFLDLGYISSTWRAKVSISFEESRRTSWGGVRRGVPFVSLSLKEFAKGSKTFREYASFAHDREIGTIDQDAVKAIRALVAHEMCHAVQYTFSIARGTVNSDRGHQTLWKDLYRNARRHLVNNKRCIVTPQQPVVVTKCAPVAPNCSSNISIRQRAFAIIEQKRSLNISRKEIVEALVQLLQIKPTTASVYVSKVFSA